jgi:transposase
MTQKSIRPSHPALIVHGVTRTETHWLIEAETRPAPWCPSCGTPSERRHGWCRRRLHDLPIHGVPVVLELRAGKWRCTVTMCRQSIFTERLPGLALEHGRQTEAVANILAMMAHGAGGEPSRRLLARLGIAAIAAFARTLRVDILAVRNAVSERWSNGQTEGQINRLKMLKRAMFGRAGIELLRARMLPLSMTNHHQLCG